MKTQSAEITPSRKPEVPSTAPGKLPIKPVKYDPVATNRIKSSLNAARQETTPEILLKVEINIAEALLKNADPNVRDDEGETALFWAVRERRTSVVVQLLQKGANVALKDRSGETPLHEAAAYTNVDIVSRLLEKGADVNVAAADGSTPLIAAVKLGNAPVIELLTRLKQLNVNAADSEGWRALHFAAQLGDLETVRLLLARAPDVNARTQLGETALRLAQNKGNFEIEAALKEAGAREAPPEPL